MRDPKKLYMRHPPHIIIHHIPSGDKRREETGNRGVAKSERAAGPSEWWRGTTPTRGLHHSLPTAYCVYL